jgi:hypothetical protein
MDLWIDLDEIINLASDDVNLGKQCGLGLIFIGDERTA